MNVIVIDIQLYIHRFVKYIGERKKQEFVFEEFMWK